jgi:hypothetical protein
MRSRRRPAPEGGFFCYPYVRDDPLLAGLRGEPEDAVLLESARPGRTRSSGVSSSKTRSGALRAVIHSGRWRCTFALSSSR